MNKPIPATDNASNSSQVDHRSSTHANWKRLPAPNIPFKPNAIRSPRSYLWKHISLNWPASQSSHRCTTDTQEFIESKSPPCSNIRRKYTACARFDSSFPEDRRGEGRGEGGDDKEQDGVNNIHVNTHTRGGPVWASQRRLSHGPAVSLART